MLNCETLLHNEVCPVITGKKGMKSVVYVCAPGKQMFHLFLYKQQKWDDLPLHEVKF